jgi:DNA-3-methyladenine glycosylase I
MSDQQEPEAQRAPVEIAESPARQRCPWCGQDPLYQAYHDQEWGVPLHDDHRLFELLTLEGAQAGLSWITVLRKRVAYRQAFAQFDPGAVACFDAPRMAELLLDPGIVRNRLKIAATVGNAQAFLAVQLEFGSFDAYLWAWTGGVAQINHWRTLAEVPAVSPVAEALSRDLKRRGFRFVGPTIIYAFMQAAGLVDDHISTCWKRQPTSDPIIN